MSLTDSERAAWVLRAEALCAAHEARLLFLSLFGSSLYGTALPDSDTDLRGLFLPSPAALALNAAPKHLRPEESGETAKNAKRAQSAQRANTADDVDLDLWSLQYWLLDLLPAGDTGALDLLFAPSHPRATLFMSPLVATIFRQPERLVNLGSHRAVEYSLRQAKKYGAKGARLAALRRALALIETLPADERLGPRIPALVAACRDAERCRAEETREGPALLLCGKLHLGGLRLGVVTERLRTELSRYGERAQVAADREGTDCKALSHAARALFQTRELLETGRIRFPLARADELRAIKAGERPWPETGLFLERELADLARLRAEPRPHPAAYDPDFARSRVLACYDLTDRRHDEAVETAEATAPEPGAPLPVSPRAAPDFAVPEAARAAIMARLEQAEAEHGVRILFACESGSRGWGFASRDSDFDARFVYVRPLDRYLTLKEERDVLELGIEESDAGPDVFVLDVNGWDLRKALRLFHASNPVLAEWLDSPIVYVERGGLAARLRELAPRVVRPLAAWHHYRGLMVKSRAKIREGGGGLKTWFYLLRPLLAMQWLERGLGLPPMRFDRLMDGVVSEPELRAELEALVERKRVGAERAVTRGKDVPSDRLVRWAESLMPADGTQPDLPPLPLSAPPARLSDLDALFCDILHQTW